MEGGRCSAAAVYGSMDVSVFSLSDLVSICVSAAIAATHGVYSKVNTRKLTAVTGVNTADRASPRCSIDVPSKMLIVLTTASLDRCRKQKTVSGALNRNGGGI